MARYREPTLTAYRVALNIFLRWCAKSDVYALCRSDSRHPVATWTGTRDGEDVSEIFPATLGVAPAGTQRR